MNIIKSIKNQKAFKQLLKEVPADNTSVLETESGLVVRLTMLNREATVNFNVLGVVSTSLKVNSVEQIKRTSLSTLIKVWNNF